MSDTDWTPPALKKIADEVGLEVDVVRKVDELLASARDEQYLTRRDIEERYGVPYKVIYRDSRNGRLRGTRYGSRIGWRFSVAEVERWMAEEANKTAVASFRFSCARVAEALRAAGYKSVAEAVDELGSGSAVAA